MKVKTKRKESPQMGRCTRQRFPSTTDRWHGCILM